MLARKINTLNITPSITKHYMVDQSTIMELKLVGIKNYFLIEENAPMKLAPDKTIIIDIDPIHERGFGIFLGHVVEG